MCFFDSLWTSCIHIRKILFFNAIKGMATASCYHSLLRGYPVFEVSCKNYSSLCVCRLATISVMTTPMKKARTAASTYPPVLWLSIDAPAK